MRSTTFFLVSTSILLAACGDATGTAPRRPATVSAASAVDFPPGPNARAVDSPPGPGARVVDYPPGPSARAMDYPPGPGVSNALSVDYPPGPTATAKPTSGFTTIVTVESPERFYSGVGGMWSTGGTQVATCPAGTKVIAGGFHAYGTHPQDLAIESSMPNAANGWSVIVEEVGSSVSNARLKVTAICVQ